MAQYPNAKVKGIGPRPDDKARILLDVVQAGEAWEPVWFGPKSGEWYEFTHDEAIRRVREQDWTAPKQPKDGK